MYFSCYKRKKERKTQITKLKSCEKIRLTTIII
jgi:hypothetical protein